MQDVIQDHADRVEVANEALAAELEAAHKKAEARVNDRLSHLAVVMSEAFRALDEAFSAAKTELDAAIAEARAHGAEILAANAMAIQASAAGLRAQLAHRAAGSLAYLDTGDLPEERLPDTADGPRLEVAEAPQGEPADEDRAAA